MNTLDFRSLTAPMILDGATGTQLQKRGMPAGICNEQWVLEHPEALKEFQGRYAEAGADAVYAPTFGANRVNLARHGFESRVREMNLRLVELSRQAVKGRSFVGGDLAPTGLAAGGCDEALFEQLVEIFTEQAAALEEAGVDFFAVETQMSLAEARAAVLAVQEISSKPVIASFSVGSSGRTMTGSDPAAALLTLEKMGVQAFGLNCVDNRRLIAEVLRTLRPLTSLPLLVKPNAGLPRLENGRSVYDLAPGLMGEMALEFFDCGADLFGGCCGSDESHIAAIRDALSGKTLPEHPAGPRAFACSAYTVLTAEDGCFPEAAALTLDEELEDNAADAEEEGAKLLSLTVENEAQLSLLLAAQDGIRLPLRVSFADKALRARFERIYTGAAVIG